MGDNGNGHNVAKNGISSLLSSSSESDDILTQPNSNETSTSSANRPMDIQTSTSTESKSPFSPTTGSQESMSDVHLDILSPVHLPDSQSISSDYSGTRFVVQRMTSSGLQSVSSTSNSSIKIESAPGQLPRSVTFSPSTSQTNVKSQQEKSTGVLSKSPTTDAVPKPLFPPESDDSIVINEEIELLPINPRRTEIKDSPEEQAEEDIFLIEVDRSDTLLLSASEANLVNRGQPLKKINESNPVRKSGVLANELPNSPSNSEGTSTSYIYSTCCTPRIQTIVASCFAAIFVFIFITVIALIAISYNEKKNNPDKSNNDYKTLPNMTNPPTAIKNAFRDTDTKSLNNIRLATTTNAATTSTTEEPIIDNSTKLISINETSSTETKNNTSDNINLYVDENHVKIRQN